MKLLFGMCVCYFLFCIAIADGFIIPEFPFRHTARFSVVYHHVDITIENNIAKTEIDQVFRNDSSVEASAEYIFPVSSQSAVQSFSVEMNGKILEPEILNADQAREKYEEIVLRMKDPALMEYADSGMIRVRIYPFQAHEKKRIRISYTESLKTGNTLKYRYPLSTEQFSQTLIEDIIIRGKIHDPVTLVYSPTHSISVDKAEECVSFFYQEKHTRPAKDFELYLKYDVKKPSASIISGMYNNKGYYMLLMSPGFQHAEKTQPKDVIFVSDISGSMAGYKIQKSFEAIEYCLRSLQPSDRFNIILFSSGIHMFFPEPVQNSEDKRRKAGDFLKSFSARGGTNIYEALQKALRFQSKRPVYIVFITDGQPTVGKTDSEEIVALCRKEKKSNTQIFCFGLGEDLNAALVDSVAFNGGGMAEYVRNDRDIEQTISDFYDNIRYPAYTELTFNLPGEIFPKITGDLFFGHTLQCFGTFDKPGDYTMTVSGKKEEKSVSFTYSGSFNTDHVPEYIPVLWASQKIAWLMEQIRKNGEQELKDEIISLSKEFGIITPYTSYLITEKESNRNTEIYNSMIRMVSSEAKAGFSESSGHAAVAFSDTISKMKKQTRFSGKKESILKGGKVFIFSNNRYVEQRYSDEKTIIIKQFSDEYFALGRESVQIQKILSLGPVVFFYNEKWHEVLTENNF